MHCGINKVYLINFRAF